MDKKVIIIKESVYESIITDLVSFLCVTFLFAVNHRYLGGSWVIDIVVAISFFIAVIKWADIDHKTMTTEEAIKYLQGESNGQSEI